MKLTLEEFAAKVNDLSIKHCEKLNARTNPVPLFGATHHPMSARRLKMYFDEGFTPAETWQGIRTDTWPQKRSK